MFGIPATSEMEEEEEEHLLESPQPKKKDQRFLDLLLAASISFNILLTFVLLLHPQVRKESVAGASYENGFLSDLEPSKSEIELVEKIFSGGIRLNRDGDYVMDQAGHEYVDTPSPAVDEAWDLLLKGLNLDLSKDEVDMTNWTFQWPESGLFFTGLGVYHSLHCLNRLRQAIYPDYYHNVFNWATGPSPEDHIGRCINYIRQALQCHADLTPMRWKLDGPKITLLTDTRHTCRNFDKINAWAVSHRSRFEDTDSWNNSSLVIVD